MPINFTSIPSQRGMTLIEVAVTLLIAGVILAGALIGIDSYWQSQLREKQIARFERVQQAMGAFVYNHGRYPCPAFNSYTASNDDYGVEVCRDVATGAPYPSSAEQCTNNTDKTGLCLQYGRRGATPNISSVNLVLRGMLPFKTLGVSEEYAYDIYGSRLVYAVTDAMTRVYDPTGTGPTTTFSLNNGAIQIRRYDVKQNSRIEISNPPGSSHFYIFSPGKNRAGGINAAGQKVVPCSTLPTTTDEYIQCDVGNGIGGNRGANYFAHLYNLASNTPSTSAFDDRGFYFAPSDPNAWGAGKNVNVDAENLGLGSNNPEYQLDIGGDILVRNDLIVTGNGLCVGTSCADPADMVGAMECTVTGTGINAIPGGWKTGDFTATNCVAPSQAVECDKDNNGNFKMLAGIEGGRPICVRTDFGCEPKQFVLCEGRSSEYVYTTHFTANGTDDVFDSSNITKLHPFTRFTFKCRSGVWADLEPDYDIVPPGTYPGNCRP